MNLKTEIQNVLLADATVTAITGANTSARIWASWPRTDEAKCVVVETDEDTDQNDLRGLSDMTISVVTVTCRESTDALAHALWSAVRDCLAGYSGTFEAILDGTDHSTTPKSDGSTGHWYDRIMTFTILWSP